MFFNGVLLHQTKPVFFVNRLDFSLNILLLSDIGNAIIKHYALQVVFDVIYFLLPLLLFFTGLKNYRIQYSLAALNIVYNFMYTLLITSVSALSMQWFVGWVIIPIVFMFKRELSFLLCTSLPALCIFADLFFRRLVEDKAGGLFNLEQMSAILLRQHITYLLAAPSNWFGRFIYFLVNHTYLSYAMYFAGTVAELFFGIGFFTRRYDRYLIVIFLLFVIFDFFLMKINYFSWAAFLGCLWLSKYDEPSMNQKSLA